MLFVQEGFTFRNFLMDALAIFVFIVWFWLLTTVARICFDATIFPAGLKPFG
jgi:hypothetical protein